MQVVLASNNSGKIAEIKAIVSCYDMTIIPQADLGIGEVEESGFSFIENALIKARYASSFAKMPAIADDSGLVVPALKGQPGIYSSRFAGPHAVSSDNIKKLLTELKLTPETDRSAFFYSILVYLRHEYDPCPLFCEGIWHGKILSSPRGTLGFGYDPVFYDLNYQCSAAELPREIKNQISHRGQAMRQLLSKLAGMTEAR